MPVLETERLILRHLTTDDAQFMFDLVNDPSWLRFIGDRGVRTLDDAREYLRKGAIASYVQNGFGLYLTAQKESGISVGICGLVKREGLTDIDIGFAFLPQFVGQGYAFESATAVMKHARDDIGLKRVVAITSPDNKPSIRVLEKLGFTFERTLNMSDKDEVNLYGRSV